MVTVLQVHSSCLLAMGKNRFTFHNRRRKHEKATEKMEEYDLLQCIDKALDGFGSSAKNAIFWRMTMLHNSSRSEVISDPRIFANVIEETFGGGALGIEMAIIDELNKKFSLSAKGARSLVDAINEAKKQVIITYAPNCKASAPTPRARQTIFA